MFESLHYIVISTMLLINTSECIQPLMLVWTDPIRDFIVSNKLVNHKITC